MIQIIVLSVAAIVYALGVLVFTTNCALESLQRSDRIGILPILVGLSWPIILAAAVIHLLVLRVTTRNHTVEPLGQGRPSGR